MARSHRVVLAFALALAGCGAKSSSRAPAHEDGPAQATAASPDDHAEYSAVTDEPPGQLRYEVRLDESLNTLIEEVCFSGRAPGGLTTSKDGERFVEAAFDDQGRPLDWTSGVLDTSGLDGRCVEFRISVGAMLGAGGWGMGTRAVRLDDDLLLSPSYWLWYPSARRERARGRVHFDLPEDYRAAVGWRRAGEPNTETFEIAPEEYDWRTHAAFGRFELAELSVGRGEVFEVAIMGAPPKAGLEGIHAWIESSANAVGQLFDGHFPRRRATAIVIPVPGGGQAVHFGLVTRGGDPSVIFFVSQNADASAFIGEWTAIHELSHMAMPLVRRRDAWLSEGFATYYQEILRARAGLYDEAPRTGVSEAQLQQIASIERLAYGFERADRRDGLSLSEASDGMKGGYARVYWGGAMVAFWLDQTLRDATDGQRSLDDVMRAWMDCCRDQVKIWTADELFDAVEREVGAWTGDPELLTGEAQRLIDRTGLPNPDPELESLGVDLDASGAAQVEPGADASAATRRRALLGPVNARSTDPRD